MFKFVKQPENIKVGSRLLFRQGTTKGMGEVIKIYSILDPDSGQCSSNDEAEGGMLVDDQERWWQFSLVQKGHFVYINHDLTLVMSNIFCYCDILHVIEV